MKLGELGAKGRFFHALEQKCPQGSTEGGTVCFQVKVGRW